VIGQRGAGSQLVFDRFNPVSALPAVPVEPVNMDRGLVKASAVSGILICKIKKRIEPMNSVGLMDSSKKNMYTHTAVEM